MTSGLIDNTSMPQVVILAGGLGTRLGKLTESTPKSLINVDNKPIITHILDWIAGQGCNRALLLTGHLGVMFDDYHHDRVELTVVKEATPLGTGGALWNAVDHLEDEFILLWGDDFHPIDYH
ncbi:MAG: sugar nucleotidyltransferase, partial [Euryarchaeota archaeon]|nr:sugar nucleotidyltransferase [Euryarchaeota archaeon]